MNDENIGKALLIPSGAINIDSSDSEDDDKIAEAFNTLETVTFEFENKNSCAFGNMANLYVFW